MTPIRPPLVPAFTAALALLIAGSIAVAQTPSQSLPLASPTPRQAGNYGWSVSGIPDVDGDGLNDVVIGAEAESSPRSANSGRVHIHSGADGHLISDITPPLVQPLGTFGWAVAGTPDMNGDGRGDVLIGAPFEQRNGVFGGRAYLYSGATGQLLRAWVSPLNQDQGGYGTSVAWTPDVDGDLVDDVVIGAPYENVAPFDRAGRVYVYSGRTGIYIRTLFSINRKTGGQFGYSVAGIADVSGDGRGVVVIGAPFETASEAGRVYIYNPRTGIPVRAWASPNAVPSGHFGFAVAGIGDANGDGTMEVLVGAPYEQSSNQFHSGRAYVFSGRGPGLRWLVSPHPQTEGNFGTAVAGGRWWDNAPAPFAIVGAPEEDSPVSGGHVYIYNLPAITAQALSSPGGETKGKFGAAVAGCGDTNGGGNGSIVIGSYFEENTGRAYIAR
jgi:hypothetical protein